MKLNVEHNCGNCDAFLLNKDLQVKAGLPRQGWCRANPPALVQVMLQQMTARGMETAPGFQGIFVPTASDCWCRQWRAVANKVIDLEVIPDAKPATLG